MKIKIIFLAILCASPLAIFANSETRTDYAHQKDIQNLLNRIEVLEHSVLKLQNQVDSLKIRGVSQNTQEKVGDDVFDVLSPPKEGEGAHLEITAQPKIETLKEDLNEGKKEYDLALASLKDNKLEEAEEQFASFVKNHPKSSLQSNAYFWYAETFFKRNLFDRAAVNYLKGYKQFPKGAKASDSLLKLALSLGELNKKQEACAMLSRLDAEFPSRAATSIKRTGDARIKFGCK